MKIIASSEAMAVKLQKFCILSPSPKSLDPQDDNPGRAEDGAGCEKVPHIKCSP
jgi:hypothetical protein